MGDHLLERKVLKWTHFLEKEDKIEHALKRLESVQINLRLLSETGVGKAVNSLRKHPVWGERACALVSRWKNVARAETAAEARKQRQLEDTDNNSSEHESDIKPGTGHDRGESDHHKNSGPIKSSKNNATTTIKKMPKIERIDEEELDDFSAQLASADHITRQNKNTSKKRPRITAESIQTSLMQSLAAVPTTKTEVRQNAQQSHSLSGSTSNGGNDLSLDINMFKPSKEIRRVYAGRKQKNGELKTHQEAPRLYDICIRILINNIDAIEETGDLPFYVLEPILQKATAGQLRKIEEKNPHLLEDTDKLWAVHCKREFSNELEANKQRWLQLNIEVDEEELEECEDEFDYFHRLEKTTWRERYFEYLHDREQKLRRLSEKIKSKTNELMEPQRKAIVTAPIAPRHVRKRQLKSGMVVNAEHIPSAMELTRARRQIFENGNDADLRHMPSAIRNTTSKLGSRSGNGTLGGAMAAAKKKPQRGPLMMKTLKMLKKRR